ncbi:uncharacterized protein [Chironomus tepperi]|uniref:uncharacterized protein isoform X1 n=1 Tax=Chironomus tepperi TaxID=113505 RepID=UPI00391F8497
MSSFDITTLSNCFSSQSSKNIQEYWKTFNDEVVLSTQELSTNNLVYNNTSNALNNFVSTFVSNDLNDEYMLYNTASGFNPYENLLDHENLCELSPNDYYGNNEIGYIINPNEVSYLDLDSSQSNAMSFDEAEQIPESFEEIFQSANAFINEVKCSLVILESFNHVNNYKQPKSIIQPKKTTKKEGKVSKRGRGRPPTEIKKLKIKVEMAEKSNDKVKIRTEKNNQASKEYRERKAEKRKQLEMDLEIETENYLNLKKIHTKLSLKIKQLEHLIKMHSN